METVDERVDRELEERSLRGFVPRDRVTAVGLPRRSMFPPRKNDRSACD